jgi:hypothetical protein
VPDGWALQYDDDKGTAWWYVRIPDSIADDTCAVLNIQTLRQYNHPLDRPVYRFGKFKGQVIIKEDE